MRRARPTLTNISTIAETRWLKLESLKYTDAKNQERSWDRVSRVTPTPQGTEDSNDDPADAVAIFPLLKKFGSNVIQTVLVKQYRPPLDAFTIELPAGLIDAGETPQQCAIRELKEETGYIAKLSDCQLSGTLPLSPGLSNESVMFCTVSVDMATNQNPVQDLEESEDIELIRVDLNDLEETLLELAKDQRTKIFLGLWTLARGMTIGKQMMKTSNGTTSQHAHDSSKL